MPIKGNFDRNFNRMKKITKNIFHKQFACKMASLIKLFESLKSSTLIGVHTCKSNGLIEKKPRVDSVEGCFIVVLCGSAVNVKL